MTIDALKRLLRQIEGKKALVVGDVMLDVFCHGSVGRVNPENHAVPLVDFESEEYRAGGAANVAANIRALGAHVTLLGAVGCDEAGERLAATLEQQGIDFAAVSARGGTIEKKRYLGDGKCILRLDRESKNPEDYRVGADKIDELLKKMEDQCHLVLFSDYAKGVITDELLKIISPWARARHIPVILDPKPKNRLNFGGMVDVITPNRKEAMELAGLTGQWSGEMISQVCQGIHARYPLHHLVITMSEEGHLISTCAGSWECAPTCARLVADVTGAGDTFVAALACALAAGAVIQQAAWLANMASGVVVGKPGTALAAPAEIVEYAHAWVP